jgi:N-acetyl-alpha-D-glucosaminyl L-malate synthase BshA
MAEVAGQCELDLLHVHYAVPHATSAYLARQMLADERDLRIVTTLHGTDITLVGNDPSYSEITRFSIAQADGVTAVSRFLARETQARFGIADAIEVIPNFVDTARFSAAARERARKAFSGPGERVLIHVSNFRPVKRIGDVVGVFARVAQEMPARLLMVGDGPELSLAQQRVSELGLTGRVDFLGRQDGIEAILPAADIFLLPSDAESFGLAALEAQACEVPVVGAAAGGLPEVVEHGVTGYLAPVGDVEGMARYALMILGESERREAMGAAARSRARERFEEAAIVAQYEACYERILAQAPVPALPAS